MYAKANVSFIVVSKMHSYLDSISAVLVFSAVFYQNRPVTTLRYFLPSTKTQQGGRRIHFGVMTYGLKFFTKLKVLGTSEST